MKDTEKKLIYPGSHRQHESSLKMRVADNDLRYTYDSEINIQFMVQSFMTQKISLSYTANTYVTVFTYI